MKWLAIDCETTGLDWHDDKLHGLGVMSSEAKAASYFMFDAIPDKVRAALANPHIPKVGHNLHGFDAKVLRRAGFEINGDLHDTMVLANLHDADQPLGLKYLSDKYFGEESLERKRALDVYMKKAGAAHIGVLCAKDLLDPLRPHSAIIADYCKEDVENTAELYLMLLERVQEMDDYVKGPMFGCAKGPMDYWLEEAVPLERVLFEMEYRGVRVDINAIEGIKADALENMARIEARLNKIFAKRKVLVEAAMHVKACEKYLAHRNKKPPKSGTEKTIARRDKSIKAGLEKLVPGQGALAFKWSNANHLAKLLYEHCDLPRELISRTPKGTYCTDKAAIERIQANIPGTPSEGLITPLELISEYKLHGKIASTYTGSNKKGILSKIKYENGVPRVFPQYRQTTSTGRISSSAPNMQNLKRDSMVKKFFIPDNDNDVFDDADYSQIELRTATHLSGDVAMIDAYRRGADLHLLTAAQLFKREVTKKDDIERQAGKRTNFLTIFRGGSWRLREELKKDTGVWWTKKECQGFINTWFELYPGVKEYLDDQLAFFEEHKFVISSTGRIRRLPDIYFGLHLSWVENGDTETEENGKERKVRVPNYSGPAHLREKLIAEILFNEKRLSRMHVTEEMIGRLAQRKYSHACKAGYNLPIQCLAASMTKRAMIALHNAGRIIANQVHDNLTVPRQRNDFAAKRQLIDIMENVYPLGIPVVADTKTLSTFHPKDIVLEKEGE